MSKQLDATYWNQRYVNNDSAWDVGHITTPLKEYFDQLINKDLRILIPGAGNAYEAQYLVENGFTNVFVCDLAPAPLDNLKQRCPAIKSENLLLQDFFKLQNIQFDLIVEQTFFCALDPALRPKYFTKMEEILAPGGKLVGLLFDDKLNDDKPPFGGNKEEYQTYIPAKLKILKLERAFNSIKPRFGRELFMLLQKATILLFFFQFV